MIIIMNYDYDMTMTGNRLLQGSGKATKTLDKIYTSQIAQFGNQNDQICVYTFLISFKINFFF